MRPVKISLSPKTTPPLRNANPLPCNNVSLSLQEPGALPVRRPRRRQLHNAAVGPPRGGGGGALRVQLRRGHAAVPGRRGGARAARRRHALLRLLGTDLSGAFEL